MRLSVQSLKMDERKYGSNMEIYLGPSEPLRRGRQAAGGGVEAAADPDIQVGHGSGHWPRHITLF